MISIYPDTIGSDDSSLSEVWAQSRYECHGPLEFAYEVRRSLLKSHNLVQVSSIANYNIIYNPWYPRCPRKILTAKDFIPFYAAYGYHIERYNVSPTQILVPLHWVNSYVHFCDEKEIVLKTFIVNE